MKMEESEKVKIMNKTVKTYLINNLENKYLNLKPAEFTQTPLYLALDIERVLIGEKNIKTNKTFLQKKWNNAYNQMFDTCL